MTIVRTARTATTPTMIGVPSWCDSPRGLSEEDHVEALEHVEKCQDGGQNRQRGDHGMPAFDQAGNHEVTC